ncbi:MAG: response regulator [Caulobacteraceae bacterium]
MEDEPLIRMLAVDMLDALGYVAVEAASGEEALAFDDRVLREATCLMIDLGLPDMSGEEVARRLRLRRPDLPVILTTGADASRARANLAGEGSVGVLEKPYQFNDLHRVLGELPAVARGVA